MEWDQYNRLQKGPLQPPAGMVAAQTQLQLFITYLRQSATEIALKDVASKRPGSAATAGKVNHARYVLVREIRTPLTTESLCYLVGKAPFLELVVKWAEKIKDETMLPAKAIPSPELVAVCVKAYHDWMDVLSRTRYE